jgi:hypothetical protein
MFRLIMRERLVGCDAVKQFNHDRGWNSAKVTVGEVPIDEINVRTIGIPADPGPLTDQGKPRL